MAKQTVEIESITLDRFEIVRLKTVGYFGTTPDELRVTFEVRPTWKPPSWLKPGSWIWSNCDGLCWHVSAQKPEWQGGWGAVDSDYSIIDTRGNAIDFTPPPWTDAKSSLRKI